MFFKKSGLILIALTVYPAHAAELTCSTAPSYEFPRTTTYSQNSGEWIDPMNKQDTLFPGISVLIFAPTKRVLKQSELSIVNINVSDDIGTKYATPIPRTTIQRYDAWISPTVIPKLAKIIYWSISYNITPADGSTLSFPTTGRTQIFTGQYRTDTYYYGGTTTGQGDTTLVPGHTISYPAPNQHWFGDISPSTDGLPLILPPPQEGSLRANILWSGPRNTTMTGTIGAATPTNIPPDTAKLIDTTGKGLQVDLHASETAEPGPISGNLTLTLTCP